ncbi:TetR/AcrR family transcriptional regulator [Enterococcus sp. LJL120]
MVHRYDKDTQERILTEANRLFMSRGYLGTSTREIAKSVGITQPNLYHYYKDKETLYRAVVEKLLQTVGVSLREIVDNPAQNFQEKLTAMAEYLIATHFVDLFMMLHDMETQMSPEIRGEMFVLWNKFYRQPFEDLFVRNQQELRPNVSPKLAARHFFLILAPYINQKRSPMEASIATSQLIDLYLHGVSQES